MSRALPIVLALVALGCSPAPDPGDSGGDDAGPDAPATATTDVSVYVEPSDGAQALLASIQGAQSSIHMTMYLLTWNNCVNALIAQAKAGRDVKVVLNKNFPTTGQSNDTVFSQLQAGGVHVAWAPSTFTYTHEKAVIIDGTSAWIMTMNVTYTSPTSNREYLGFDRDPDDVAVVSDERESVGDGGAEIAVDGGADLGDL